MERCTDYKLAIGMHGEINMHKQPIAPILTIFIYNPLSTLIDTNMHKKPLRSISTIRGNGTDIGWYGW